MDEKAREVRKYSNHARVEENARRYFGRYKKVYLSSQKDKKYMIQGPSGYWIHFGQMGYEDFTKHLDLGRRARYLARARGIRGEWAENPFSPNMLSIHLLWEG